MKVFWTPTALDDLERIIDYIAERNLVAAIELHALIDLVWSLVLVNWWFIRTMLWCMTLKIRFVF
jgi:hypothetical protein